MEFNQSEAERYLGMRGYEPDPSIRKRMKECAEILMRESDPKHIVVYEPVHFEGDTLFVGDMEIHSRSLYRNMKGCTKAALMACTIGEASDRLVHRSEITSLLDTAIYQAIGAALIESYCDEVNEEIKRKASEESLYARPRFSPGYGDLPLQLQKEFMQVLDMRKNIGVELLDSLLMVPTKSVTAIIGLSPVNQNCILAGCETCNLHLTCEFARDRKD